jgi:serine/threonine-protein phosphatase 6 regulatory subunit 3
MSEYPYNRYDRKVINNSTIIFRICKTDYFNTLLNLFKQYCWNNFLHNYVKKCVTYAIQSFDTIPEETILVISALQKHVSSYSPDYLNVLLTDLNIFQIITECKIALKLMDCWYHNDAVQ